MISEKMKKFLMDNNIEYEHFTHPTEYSAMRTAASQHISGKNLVKSIIVNADGKFVMCVLPACYNVDMQKVKQLMGAKLISLATEDDLNKLFPECELGGEAPFGNLYNDLLCLVDQSLSCNSEIIFNAESHTDLIKISGRDFFRICKHTLADIGVPLHVLQAG